MHTAKDTRYVGVNDIATKKCGNNSVLINLNNSSFKLRDTRYNLSRYNSNFPYLSNRIHAKVK